MSSVLCIPSVCSVKLHSFYGSPRSRPPPCFIRRCNQTLKFALYLANKHAIYIAPTAALTRVRPPSGALALTNEYHPPPGSNEAAIQVISDADSDPKQGRAAYYNPSSFRQCIQVVVDVLERIVVSAFIFSAVVASAVDPYVYTIA